MSRLKFRQFVKGEFHYWGFFKDDKTETHWSGPVTTYPVIPSEQFTGLCDRNGVEIYEGDILEFENGDRFVIRCENWLQFYVHWIGDPECGDQARDLYRIERAEILGNIHENGELL